MPASTKGVFGHLKFTAAAEQGPLSRTVGCRERLGRDTKLQVQYMPLGESHNKRVGGTLKHAQGHASRFIHADNVSLDYNTSDLNEPVSFLGIARDAQINSPMNRPQYTVVGVRGMFPVSQPRTEKILEWGAPVSFGLLSTPDAKTCVGGLLDSSYLNDDGKKRFYNCDFVGTVLASVAGLHTVVLLAPIKGRSLRYVHSAFHQTKSPFSKHALTEAFKDDSRPFVSRHDTTTKNRTTSSSWARGAARKLMEHYPAMPVPVQPIEDVRTSYTLAAPFITPFGGGSAAPSNGGPPPPSPTNSSSGDKRRAEDDIGMPESPGKRFASPPRERLTPTLQEYHDDDDDGAAFQDPPPRIASEDGPSEATELPQGDPASETPKKRRGGIKKKKRVFKASTKTTLNM